MAKRSYAVIGLGQFGQAVVEELLANGADVIAIDNTEEAVKKVGKGLSTCFVADATNEKALAELGIKEVDAAIVAFGENKEASILTTVILHQMGIKQIIVRVDDDYYVNIMKKLGATEVVTPQKAAGAALANRLGNDDYKDFYKLDDKYSVVSIQPEENAVYTDNDGVIFTNSPTINIGGAGTVNLYGGVKLIDGTDNGTFKTVNDGEHAFSGTLVIGKNLVQMKTVAISGENEGTLVFDLNGYTSALDANGLLRGTTSISLPDAGNIQVKGGVATLGGSSSYFYTLTPTTYTLATGTGFENLDDTFVINDAELDGKSYTVIKTGGNKLTVAIGKYTIDAAAPEQADIVAALADPAADTKGGLTIADGSDVTLNNITVAGKRTAGGGGIKVSYSKLNALNATFNGNYSTTSGGAIHNTAGDWVFNGTTAFVNNTSVGTGGAIFSGIQANVDPFLFTFLGDAYFGRDGQHNGNHASNGGAIYNYSYNNYTHPDMVFDGFAGFYENTATQNGGAIHNYYGKITFNGNAVFKNNSAGARGGAVYARNRGELVFNANALFTGNTANNAPNAFYLEGGRLSIQPASGKTFTDYDGISYAQSGSMSPIVNIGGAGAINLYGGATSATEEVNLILQTVNAGEHIFTGTLTVGNKAVNAKTVDLTRGTVVFDLANYTSAFDNAGMLTATDGGFTLSSILKIKNSGVPVVAGGENDTYDYIVSPVTYTLAGAETLTGSYTATDVDATNNKAYTLTATNNKLIAALSGYAVDGAVDTGMAEALATSTGKNGLLVNSGMTLTVTDMAIKNKAIAIGGAGSVIIDGTLALGVLDDTAKVQAGSFTLAGGADITFDGANVSDGNGGLILGKTYTVATNAADDYSASIATTTTNETYTFTTVSNALKATLSAKTFTTAQNVAAVTLNDNATATFNAGLTAGGAVTLGEGADLTLAGASALSGTVSGAGSVTVSGSLALGTLGDTAKISAGSFTLSGGGTAITFNGADVSDGEGGMILGKTYTVATNTAADYAARIRTATSGETYAFATVSNALKATLTAKTFTNLQTGANINLLEGFTATLTGSTVLNGNVSGGGDLVSSGSLTVGGTVAANNITFNGGAVSIDLTGRNGNNDPLIQAAGALTFNYGTLMNLTGATFGSNGTYQQSVSADTYRIASSASEIGELPFLNGPEGSELFKDDTGKVLLLGTLSEFDDTTLTDTAYDNGLFVGAGRTATLNGLTTIKNKTVAIGGDGTVVVSGTLALGTLDDTAKVQAGNLRLTEGSGIRFDGANVSDGNGGLDLGKTYTIAEHTAGDYTGRVFNLNRQTETYSFSGTNSLSAKMTKKTFSERQNVRNMTAHDGFEAVFRNGLTANGTVALGSGATLKLNGTSSLFGTVSGRGNIVSNGDLTIGRSVAAQSLSMSSGILTLMLSDAALTTPIITADTISLTGINVSYTPANGYAMTNGVYRIAAGDLTETTAVQNNEIITIGQKRYSVSIDRDNWNLMYFGEVLSEKENAEISAVPSTITRSVSITNTHQIGKRLTNVSMDYFDISLPSVSTSGADTQQKGRSGGEERKSNVWGEMFYNHSRLEKSGRSNAVGFVAGADGETDVSGRLVLGAAAGYTGTKASQSTAKTYSGFLYGHYEQTNRFSYNGVLGYLFTDFKVDNNKNKFRSHSVMADLSANYYLGAGFTGNVGGRYFFSHQKSTKTYRFDDVSSATAVGGVKYAKYSASFGAHADLNALYDVHSDKSGYRITRNGAVSNEKGIRLPRFGVEAGVGVSYKKKAWSFDLDYTTQQRKDYSDQTVMMKVNYSF